MVINSVRDLTKDGLTDLKVLPGYVLGFIPSPDTTFTDLSGLVPCDVGDLVACVRDVSTNNVIFTQDSHGARPALAKVGDKYVLRGSHGKSLTCNVPVAAGSRCFAGACSVNSPFLTVIQASEHSCYYHPNDISANGYVYSSEVLNTSPKHFVLQKHNLSNWEYRVNGANVQVAPNANEWEGLYVGDGPYSHSCDFDLYGLIVCYTLAGVYLPALETYLKGLYA